MKEKLIKTREHLAKLGYPAVGVEFILGKLCIALNKFAEPAQAVVFLEENFHKFVCSRFGEMQLYGFLKDIDPGIPNCEFVFLSDGEYADYSPLEDWEKADMSKLEIEEFEKERQRFLIESRQSKQKVLEDECIYDTLNSSHYRASKRHLVDEKKLPPVRWVNTPTGGQPGFRRKRRIR